MTFSTYLQALRLIKEEKHIMQDRHHINSAILRYVQPPPTETHILTLVGIQGIWRLMFSLFFIPFMTAIPCPSKDICEIGYLSNLPAAISLMK